MRISYLNPLVAIAITVGVCGCIAIPIEESSGCGPVVVNSRARDLRGQVKGINPIVTSNSQSVTIDLFLQGDFEKTFDETIKETTDSYNLAMGFFPGVMTCKGEIDDCAVNGLAVCWYNLIFLGLPTVYGMFIPPLDPEYPEQSDSIVGSQAFTKSALIGFAKYRKSQSREDNRARTETHLECIRLEGAVLRCSSPRHYSSPGQPLVLQKNELPVDRTINLSFSLPGNHPLKVQLRDFEGASFPVECEPNP